MFLKAACTAFVEGSGKVYIFGGQQLELKQFLRVANLIPYQWSIKTHHCFPQHIKQSIFLIFAFKKFSKENIISSIPKPVLFLIFEYFTSPPFFCGFVIDYNPKNTKLGGLVSSVRVEKNEKKNQCLLN